MEAVIITLALSWLASLGILALFVFALIKAGYVRIGPETVKTQRARAEIRLASAAPYKTLMES